MKDEKSVAPYLDPSFPRCAQNKKTIREYQNKKNKEIRKLRRENKYLKLILSGDIAYDKNKKALENEFPDLYKYF